MSGTLPRLTNTRSVRTFSVSQFGGLEHTLAAQNGALWDMRNLTGDHAPVLASRPRRWIVKKLAKPNGIYCTDRLFLADGTSLTVDGETVGQVTDTPKSFCGISGRVVIFPDKLIYTADGTLESLEASYTASGLVFGNGTYAEQEAEANSITTEGEPFPFRVGDAVTISGCTEQPENNKTPIIREISEDGKTLRFYEYSFTVPEGGSVTEPGEVTLSRTVPDLDFCCTNENRLWGCKGDTIFASKLGDPYNWNVFDGVATDAFSVETGTPGSFTGCCSFLGYPCFFKEDRIFKVYGTKPTNFEVMGSATLGVSEGSGKSLAVAGETLFYLSRAGIVAYSGGIPQSVSAPLGDVKYRCAVAGSDGVKYCVSMEAADGGHTLLVYDTSKGLWHREDETRLIGTGYLRGLYGLTADGDVLLLETPEEAPEGSVREEPQESCAEFGDFTFDAFGGLYPVRLRLRLRAEEGVTVTAEIQYDSDGVWRTAETVKGTRKSEVYLAAKVRRCRHFRLRLRADGDWQLRNIEFELYDGQYVRK